MDELESALEHARELEPESMADSIREIGFECTRCGRCCSGEEGDPHTATIFPDEIRSIVATRGEEWDAVARPIPYGLSEGAGETFEWALQSDGCGDCRFLAMQGDETACTIYDARPLICRTYPFSVAIGMSVGGAETDTGSGVQTGTTRRNPREARNTGHKAIAGHQHGVVEQVGKIRAHECPGIGSDIEPDRARELAITLKERTVEDLEQAIGVRDQYDPGTGADEPVVVHDSEGPKRPDGTPLARPDEGEDGHSNPGPGR